MIDNTKDKKNFIYLFYLTILLFFSHFFPFERSSISPDDYAFLLSNKEGFFNFLLHPHRPLQYIWYEIQSSITGTNGFYGLLLLYFSNLIFVFVLYYLYSLIFKNNKHAFVISIINLVLINKIEIYQGPVFIHIILASTIYILVIVFYYKFLNLKNKNYLLISLIFYLLGIFWYENGFFIPLILFIYKIITISEYKKINYKKIILEFLPFIIIIIFYSYFRLSGAFGYSSSFSGRQINLLLFFQSLQDLFNNIIGRTFIRISIYGLYNFIKINYLYISILILFNSFFIFLFYKLIKNTKYIRYNKNELFLFFLIFIITLIPSIISGNIGPRSMILSFVGFTPIIYFLFSFLKYKNIFISFFVLISLIISQGNSWTHVIASRINYEVFKTLTDYKSDILKAEFIIFDKYSFAENIPYSFVSNEYNIFKTYYGAQVFEDWGIHSMIHLAVDKSIKSDQIFVVSESPNINDNNEVLAVVYRHAGYKLIEKYSSYLNADKIIIIDYKKVYNKSFYFGLNR